MTDTAIITMPAAGAPAAEAAATDSVPHLRAFMLALDPTDEQKVALAQHFGASRWAFNHAHALKDASRQAWRDAVDELTAGGLDEKLARKHVKTVLPTKATIQKRLNELKGDDRKGIDGLAPWWHTVSTYAFQSAFADADLAWSNWMSSLGGRRAGKPVGYPRFKKRGACRDSVRIHHDVNKPTIRPDGYRRI
ncbi:MAG: helix-turn-helix domain-containing protein, partial [Actinomycetota bacterium]|nr:helix-turn-helix domain-containing protein [Actinomycetota bacterium]